MSARLALYRPRALSKWAGARLTTPRPEGARRCPGDAPRHRSRRARPCGGLSVSAPCCARWASRRSGRSACWSRMRARQRPAGSTRPVGHPPRAWTARLCPTAPPTRLLSALRGPPRPACRHSPVAGPVTSPAASPNKRAAPAAEVALGPRPTGVETMDWPSLARRRGGLSGLLPQPEPHPDRVRRRPHRSRLDDRGRSTRRAGGASLGEPFVGRAGELLDRMLEAVGLTRAEAPAAQQVFIANVLKCRPPANRNPLPPEVAQCEPYLLRQMALVQPRVVLAMGRFAGAVAAQVQRAAWANCVGGCIRCRACRSSSPTTRPTSCAHRPTRPWPGTTCAWRARC